MNLEARWQDISSEPGGAGTAGLVIRRIDPRCPDDLFVGARLPGGTRAVLLRLPAAAVLSRSALVQSRGFTTHIARFENDPRGCCDLLLEATEAAFNPIFGVLAEDLVGRVVNRPPASDAGLTFLGALQQWKRFFDAAGAEGLSQEQQLGLFAELHFLEQVVLPHIPDVCAAVSGWVGPDPLSKDFQYPPCAIEVKATASREPAKVRINGERQLDTEGIPRLYLSVLLVERAVTGGASLSDVVQRVRAILADTTARMPFEEKLLAYGYHDAHRTRYEALRYIVHDQRHYEVRAGFPRLTSGLPAGVGDLTYTVTLSACASFRVEPSMIPATLTSNFSYDS